MSIETSLSTVLGIVIISGAIGVIFLPMIVYAAFLLGAVFLSLAGIYILLNADFVGAAQVLIYVGAINVLILFAIMLVNPGGKLARIPEGLEGLEVNPSQYFGKACVALGLLGWIYQMIRETVWLSPPWSPETERFWVIGGHLLNDDLLPFEVMSIVLLVALVGAIVLARREA
jgi:NAD(P)H-quinone oxidoreductase subunit 6